VRQAGDWFALSGGSSTTEASETTTLTCDVFVNDPPSHR
jgi:hypothetical protein